MNMREPSAFQARSETGAICDGTIVFDRSAPNTTYAVMSLVSDAGSRRSSAFCAASVWPLVTSVTSHPAAAALGAGMAGAAPATVQSRPMRSGARRR